MSSNLEQASGYISIEINVDCPHCDAYLNLLDESDVSLSCEQGDLMRECFGADRWGTENSETEVTCLGCNETFNVNEISY